MSDIEKLFNFLDTYPSIEEIKDAKMSVLKCNDIYFWYLSLVKFFLFKIFTCLSDYKRRANSTSVEKDAMLDLIYYIYPPKGSRLKSTRKSTWLNPVVNGEDALRLRGSKLLEVTSFEKPWKMVREHSLSHLIPKNTPDLTYKSPDPVFRYC